MSTAILEPPKAAIDYPDSDCELMADNMTQARRIMTIQGNLCAMLRDQPDVFSAADNLIYAVEGLPAIVMAPDVYVAYGRPKGDRGSYRVWVENNIFPQVIFEVLSPYNRPTEMMRKHDFYQKHGAEEYYYDDIVHNEIIGYLRNPQTGRFEQVANMDGFVSPRLGIRFEKDPEETRLYRPDGTLFLSFEDLDAKARDDAERAFISEKVTQIANRRADEQQHRADEQQHRADEQQHRADEQQRRAEAAERKMHKLRAKLLALGIDPDQNGADS